MGMEFSIRMLFMSFVLTIGISFLLLFFVFASTIYTFFDVLLIILVGTAIFLGSFMFQYQMSVKGFPIEVTIYEERAGSMFIVKDRAKRIFSGEQGKFAYLLRNKRIKTKPIDYKYIYIGEKGQPFLSLHMPQANEFHPITLSQAKDAKLMTTHENARYWYSEQLRRNAEKYSKKFGFEKYSGVISLLVVMVGVAMLLYVFLGQMQGVIAQIGGIQVQGAEILELGKEILQEAKGIRDGGGTGLPPGIDVPPPPI